jgi:hypothetical protein
MSQVYAIAKAIQRVGVGVSDAYFLELVAIGKMSLPSRFIVANEYISAKMGTYLGLPIPPFALLQQKGTNPQVWFGSLDYRLTGESLPQIDPETFVEEFPNISTGIILFDIWIANSDRHEGNLNVDRSAQKPRVNVFDHSHSLFLAEGAKRLERLADHAGITASADPGATGHCLIEHLGTDAHFDAWLDRIEDAPRFLIRQACRDVVEVELLSSDEGDRVEKFLTSRQRRIGGIVEENEGSFPKIAWGWSRIGKGQEPEIWEGPLT